MGNRTALYDQHVASGATMVDFGGWDMPLHYGSQVAEHNAVRAGAGMFDVSHMAIVDIAGSETEAFLRRVLANDVAKLDAVGRALYSVMCTEEGGVVDDLIAYRMRSGYRLVVNCATRDKDLAWLRQWSIGSEVAIRYRDDLAMIAVQGPQARQIAAQLVPGVAAEDVLALRPFHSAAAGGAAPVGSDGAVVARTGYTGEDGVEVMLPSRQAPDLWQALLRAGVAPCGLGSRDTLRLEAGLALYGQEMDESISPLEAGLGWTIAWEPADREFVGREVLAAQRASGRHRRLVGLLLEGRGMMRAGQTITKDGDRVGVITSGSFSPTLGRSIAMAAVDRPLGGECDVLIRDRANRASIVTLPFIRHGEPRHRYTTPEGHPA